MRATLNALAVAAPDWLRLHADLTWTDRYVYALAIINGFARNRREFWLTLSDNGGALMLTLSACVLAIVGSCSQLGR